MTDKVISVNFGPSEFSRRAPNTPYVDTVFSFSIEGLEVVSFCEKNIREITVGETMNFSDSKMRTGEKIKTITIHLEKDGCTEKSIKLVLLQEEWIAFEFSSWTEGSHITDEIYTGPFLPNNFCKSIISKYEKAE